MFHNQAVAVWLRRSALAARATSATASRSRLAASDEDRQPKAFVLNDALNFHGMVLAMAGSIADGGGKVGGGQGRKDQEGAYPEGNGRSRRIGTRPATPAM